MKAVIADDEVLIRMYIREILESNGYEVVGEAEDGLDAVTVCRKNRPDFVILDLNMPVMTGLEAARVINEEHLAGFIVVLTAYRDKDMAEQAVNMNVMGYVVKPVDEVTLIPAIKVAEHEYLQMEEIKREFDRTKETLNDRKYIERAKGLIMEKRGMTEKEAFGYIRRLSMDKGEPMAEVAKTLLKAYGEQVK